MSITPHITLFINALTMNHLTHYEYTQQAWELYKQGKYTRYGVLACVVIPVDTDTVFMAWF